MPLISTRAFYASVVDCLHVYLATQSPYDLQYDNFKPVIHELAKNITAHALMETSFFCSSLLQKNNNCFCLKVDKRRNSKYLVHKPLKQPKLHGDVYSAYTTYVDSIYDFLNWCHSKKADFSCLVNLSGYVSFLTQNGYNDLRESHFLKRCEAYYSELLKLISNA